MGPARARALDKLGLSTVADLLAYFPRQNRAISVRIPRRARQDPGVRMTGPLILLSAVSVAMGLWAGPLSQHIVGLFPG